MSTDNEGSIIKLSKEDSLIFAEAILRPPKPSEALRKLFEDYKKW